MLLLRLAVLGCVAASSYDAKWCNQYFCLDASLPAQPDAAVHYALTARTDTMSGWIAIGTGYVMDGSKMWIAWPDKDGGNCVLSERDEMGYKPPVITERPFAKLLPSAPSNNIHFSCHFTVPTSALPFFKSQSPTNITSPMGMLWAYSTTAPVLPSNSPSNSGASIKRHDTFGIFDLDFRMSSAPASKTDDKAARRKRMIQAHAVLMTLAWAVTAPIAVLFARFGRGTFAKWVACHQWIQIGLTTTCTIVGFLLAVVAIRLRDGKHFQSAHEARSGLWIHHLYNPTRTHRPPRNFLHMGVGCALLVGGLVQTKLGISKWGDQKWQVVSFWVWTGLLVATFAVGLSLLPRQLRAETNATRRKNPDVRLSRIQASFPAPIRTHKKDKFSPFPSADAPSSAEQGTTATAQLHVKYPWHKGTHTLSPSSPSSDNDNDNYQIPPPNAPYRDRPSPLSGTSPSRNLTGTGGRTGTTRHEEGTVNKDDLARAQRDLLRSRKV